MSSAPQATTQTPHTLSRGEVEILLAQLAGEVTRDSSHVYSTPVGELRSVTTVIRSLDKPALIGWASKMQSEADCAAAMAWLAEPPETRGDLLARLNRCRQAHKAASKKAADAGTEGHKLAEYEFRKRLGLDAVKPEITQPEHAYAVLAGILEWVKEHNVQPVAMEPMVYSRKYGYAGAGDLICYYEDRPRPALVDWKSSENGRIYREAWLQSHALRGAYREHGLEMDGFAIGIPRSGVGEINPVEMPWNEQTYVAFRALVAVDKWAQQQG
jgi:hypothetical protein